MIPSVLVTAAAFVFSYGLLDMLTLRQQSVVFTMLLSVYLVVRHRLGSASSPTAMGVATANGLKPVDGNALAVLPIRPPARSSAPAGAGDAPTVRASAGESARLSFYQREAVQINHLLLNSYKLNCAIDFRDPKAIVPAHGFIVYVLKQTGALRFSDLQRIEDDLAREINALHRKHRYGDVSVLAMNSQPMTLQVTRANPQRLLWSERPQKALKPMVVLLGQYWRGAQSLDLTLKLAGADSEFINGAVFGQPGSGKSTVLHIALLSVLESTPPEQVEVYCIDLKTNAFAGYKVLPQVRLATGSVQDAIATLEMFAKWCTADGKPTDGRYRWLLLDELQILLTDIEHGEYALKLLARILEAGREAGIRVLTSTQNPDAISYPSVLKPKTHFMASCHIMSDGYLRKVLGIFGAAKLRPKAEMVFVGPYGDCRVTTFWLTPEDRQEAIKTLVRRWGGGGAVAVQEARTGGEAVDLDGAVGGAGPVRTAGAMDSPREPGPLAVLPIKPARPLTADEAIALRELAKLERFTYRGELSLNRLVECIYGAKRAERITWIKDALEVQQ